MAEVGRRIGSVQRAERLLDQQMWCFGQDVRYPEGNLLLHFGFERHRQPVDASKGSLSRNSAYVLRPSRDCEIVLWGFGIFFGQIGTGAIFLRRFAFSPSWTTMPRLPAIVWSPEHLPPLGLPVTRSERGQARRLLKATALWLAGYERWVHRTAGIEYRRQCLRDWQRPGISATGVPQEWKRLATTGARFIVGQRSEAS
jgi:hypothetical protein